MSANKAKKTAQKKESTFESTKGPQPKKESKETSSELIRTAYKFWLDQIFFEEIEVEKCECFVEMLESTLQPILLANGLDPIFLNETWERIRNRENDKKYNSKYHILEDVFCALRLDLNKKAGEAVVKVIRESQKLQGEGTVLRNSFEEFEESCFKLKVIHLLMKSLPAMTIENGKRLLATAFGEEHQETSINFDKLSPEATRQIGTYQPK